MPQIRSIALVVAALFLGTPPWSAGQAGANERANGVMLKDRCLMTLDGEYPSKCKWVLVGQAVHVQPFHPQRPLNLVVGDAASLVLVRAHYNLSGLVFRDDVLSVKGVTRQENNAKKVQSWSGPRKFEPFVGDAWGHYEFKRDGHYVFESGGDGTDEPRKRGQLYRAGQLLFVDHSLIGPTFFLITSDNEICWFAGNETQCTDNRHLH